MSFPVKKLAYVSQAVYTDPYTTTRRQVGALRCCTCTWLYWRRHMCSDVVSWPRGGLFRLNNRPARALRAHNPVGLCSFAVINHLHLKHHNILLHRTSSTMVERQK